MTRIGYCPDRRQFVALNAGALDDDTAVALFDHIEECTRCSGVIAEISPGMESVEARLGDFLNRHTELRVLRSFPDSPVLDDLPIGWKSDDLDIVERIGQGGMGTVYKAIHRRLKRIVALKVLHSDRLVAEHGHQRFRVEMEAIGRVDHPNMVRAMDAGEAAGIPYLVMEFIAGDNLRDIARQTNSISTIEACEIARQAALGLAHVHDLGLVHRDVKPSNLMLTHDGTVKVLDLGLARVVEQTTDNDEPDIVDHEQVTREAMHDETEVTKTGAVLGTRRFMAPEQAINPKQVDYRADVYSLGCTLLYLLTRRFPNSGQWDSILDVTPCGDFPRVPRLLHELLREMITPSPNGRSLTMHDVARRLDTIIYVSPESCPTPATLAKAASNSGIAKWWTSLIGSTVPAPKTSDADGLQPGLGQIRQRAQERWQDSRRRRIRKFAFASSLSLVVTLITLLAFRQPTHVPNRAANSNSAAVAKRTAIATSDISDQAKTQSDAKHLKYALGTQCQVTFAPDVSSFSTWGLRKQTWQTVSGMLLNDWTATPTGASVVQTVGRLQSSEDESESAPIRLCVASTRGDRFAGIIGNAHIFFAEPKAVGWWAETSDDIEHVAISGDGQILAAAGANWVSVWNANSEECVSRFETTRLKQLALSSNGDIIAMLSMDGVVTVRARWKSTPDRPYEVGPVDAIAFTPIAAVLAIAEASGHVGLVDYHQRHYWSVGDIKLSPNESVAAIAFDRGSNALASLTSNGNQSTIYPLMSYASIKPSDPVTGLRLHFALQCGFSRVTSVCFTRDGKHLVCGSDDSSIRAFDVATGELFQQSSAHESYVRDVCFSRDDILMSVSEDGTLRVFQWPSLDVASVIHLDRCPTSVVSSLDGNDAIVGTREGTLLRVAIRSDNAVSIFCETQLGHVEWPIRMTQTGQILAINRAGWVHAFDSQGTALQKFQASEIGNTFLAPQPNGNRLTSVNSKGLIRDWDIETGGTIKKWQGHDGPISSVAYSPDGSLLATTDGRGELRIWNADSRSLEFSQDAHIGNIRDVAFNSNGQLIATAGHDGVVRIWRTPPVD